MSKERLLLKRSEFSEEEKQRMRNRFVSASLKLSDNRFEPYRKRTSSATFLGTDRKPQAHMAWVAGTGSSQVANLKPARDSPPRRSEREKLREDQWNADAASRARHMFEPPAREYEHEASVAHRGAVIGLSFMPGSGVQYLAADDCAEGSLLSCGVDGKLRRWDAGTGVPASQNSSALEVETWSKAVPLQLALAGPPEDICFLPEGNRISMRCLRTGDLLCGLAAHTEEVQCATALPTRGQLFTGGNDGRLLKWRLDSDLADEEIICLDVKDPLEDIGCLHLKREAEPLKVTNGDVILHSKREVEPFRFTNGDVILLD